MGQGNALKALKLAPSILSADFGRLADAAAAAEADGYATSLKDAAAFCLNVARGGAQGSHDLGPARVA